MNYSTRILPFLLFCFLSALLPTLTAQSNVKDSLDHNGLTRQYTVHLPPTYNGQDSVPMIVLLHGGSGSIQVTQNFTMMNPVSNRNGFIVLYPQGYTASPNGGFVWADGRGTQADIDGVDDVGYLQKVIDQVQLDFAINSAQIYMAGFSNGGFMTQRMGCEANEQLAAISSLGATMDIVRRANCNPGRPIPIMIVAATADPFVPYNGGPMDGPVEDVISADDLVDFWAMNNACLTSLDSIPRPNIDTTDNSTVTVFERTNCDCGADVSLFKVIGAGHTWPGVEIPSYEPVGGETNEDISASEELWKFFSQFEKCDVSVTSTDLTQEAPQVRVFPNPASQMLSIEGNDIIQKITITDTHGKKWLEAPVNRAKIHLELTDLPTGLYMLNVQWESGLISTNKWIKN